MHIITLISQLQRVYESTHIYDYSIAAKGRIHTITVLAVVTHRSAIEENQAAREQF